MIETTLSIIKLESRPSIVGYINVHPPLPVANGANLEDVAIDLLHRAVHIGGNSTRVHLCCFVESMYLFVLVVHNCIITFQFLFILSFFIYKSYKDKSNLQVSKEDQNLSMALLILAVIGTSC